MTGSWWLEEEEEDDESEEDEVSCVRSDGANCQTNMRTTEREHEEDSLVRS